jgi:hypothetical protein
MTFKSVSIAGRRIPVRTRDFGGDPYGQYLPDERVIELDRLTWADPKLLRETLRHEMMEATLFLSGIGWSVAYEQEPIVRAIDEIFWPAWERADARLRSMGV